WLATAEIPDDLDAYGSFLELRDKAESDVRAILEEAAEAADAQHEAADTELGQVQQRIGTFYAAFMDAEAAEHRTLAPIQPFLEEIEALENPGQLLRVSAAWQRKGMDSVLMAGAVRDAGNPQRELLHVAQSGLGLPDE